MAITKKIYIISHDQSFILTNVNKIIRYIKHIICIIPIMYEWNKQSGWFWLLFVNVNRCDISIRFEEYEWKYNDEYELWEKSGDNYYIYIWWEIVNQTNSLSSNIMLLVFLYQILYHLLAVTL